MANILRVSNTDSYITYTRGADRDSNGEVLHFTLRKKDGKGTPIAKAKLTADQLHKYICMNNTMK